MKRRFKRRKKFYHYKKTGKPAPRKRRLSGKKEINRNLFRVPEVFEKTH